MQANSFSQQLTDLNNQNEQLKTKYKKCLQELMHILSINKTMKEHIEKCSQQDPLILQLQKKVQQLNMHIDMQKIHAKELQSVKNGLEARVASLQVAIKDSESEKQRQKKQLAQIYKKLKGQEERRRFLEHEQEITPNRLKTEEELNLIKNQNQKLSKTVLRFKGIQAQKNILLSQIQHLKEQRIALNLQLAEQQQKYRSQILMMQNEIKRIRSSEAQKTKQLESKYLILQSQLTNYQTIERFMEQSKEIQQDSILFNDIRSQIQRINDNFNLYQHQSNNVLTKNRQEEERKNKIIADLESQLQKYRRDVQNQRANAEKLQKRVQEIPNLVQKLKIVEAQRRDLEEKINVLEAFMITQKHRVGFEVSQRIDQFQRKVHLLLQENAKSISGLGGLQQILILKSYVKELSELLWSQKKKQEKLKKKAQQLKQRIKQVEHQNALKMSQYNKKVENYDNLIEKLYGLLEQKVLEAPHLSKDKDFNIAINKYQEKMLRMSDQIIKLKRKNEALQQMNRTRPVSTISEEEYEKLNHATASLQADLQRFQTQNRKLVEENRLLNETLQEQKTEARELIKQKESIITNLSQEILAYQQQLKLQQQKISQLLLMNQSYEKQVKYLQEQNQDHVKTNNYLLNKYKDSDSLLEKVSVLENQVKELKKSHQAAYEQQSKRTLEHLTQLESKIGLQTQQIEAYKQENTYLYSQLQASKVQKQALFLQHHNLVAQLNSKIQTLEHLRQEETGPKAKSSKAIQQLNQKCLKLEDQNKKLATQLDLLSKELEIKQESTQKEKNTVKSANQVVLQQEDLQYQVINKTNKEVKELNNIILTLRTENLAIKNELEEKQANINELKHQIYTRQLKLQKEKSKQNLLAFKQQSEKSSQQYQKLLVAFALVSAQLEAISLKQATLDAEVQTFEDRVIEQHYQQPEKVETQPWNITSLDKNHEQQQERKILISIQPHYLQVMTTKSIQTVNQPISVVDSNWREEYQRRKQKDQIENADYHASSGSFKMIKLLKNSLKSIQLPQEQEKSGDTPKKQ